MASLLKSVAALSDEIDPAAPAGGPKGTALVLQAVFKAVPTVKMDWGERDPYVTPLVSALASGLPAEHVVRAWMQGHAAALTAVEQVDKVMSVLVQHERLKLTGASLSQACKALARGSAPPARDSKTATADDDGAASAIAKWVIDLRDVEARDCVIQGLALGFGLVPGGSGSATLAALLKLALQGSPPDIKRAVAILDSWKAAPWQDAAKAAERDLQVRAFFESAIEEVLPVFSPAVAPTRVALKKALYGPRAKKG